MSGAGDMVEPAKCRACFCTSETEPVLIRRGPRGSEWVESSIRQCANHECRNTTGGSLEERLTHIGNVYDYKYFGDYELSPEQVDAVWEAKAIADCLPGLILAAVAAVEFYDALDAAHAPGEADMLDALSAAIDAALGKPA